MSDFYVHRLQNLGAYDLQDIYRLNKLCLKQDQKPTWEWFVRRILKNPEVIYVVARDNKTGRIIGKQQLCFTPLDHGLEKMQLDQVATDPNREREGIGTAIWNELVRIANMELGEEIHWTSSGKKEGAQEYYNKMPGCERRNTNNFRFRLS